VIRERKNVLSFGNRTNKVMEGYRIYAGQKEKHRSNGLARYIGNESLQARSILLK
jgi:hypothetical protein